MASSSHATSKAPAWIVARAASRARPADFLLDDGTGPVLLISAGIGLTPVLCMLHELAARDSDREIWWIRGARRPQEHPLAAETHALLTSLPHTHEHVFYSTATPEERRRTRAAGGRLTKDKLVALSVPADATAYVSGPASFMADMQYALTAAGIDSARIHTELGRGHAFYQPRPHGAGGPDAPPAPGAARNRPAGDLRPQRHLRDLPRQQVQRARTRRRLRRSHPLEPPPDGHVLTRCAQPSTDVVRDM
ncbi:ferredoxin reductase domain-containing protein [Streptomyces mirabilis]|uniref:hypothetical protein n=1 Tax=Streptomyces mirabilis TaxID=68239 RepID=UPI003692638F